ncbi:MAG: hypothetical protein ACRDXD_04555 [Acidimicrobiia bacterium]
MVLLALIGVACGDRQGFTETSPRVVMSEPSTTVRQNDAVVKARADLAARLGVEVESIEVSKAEEVVWRDGSIGCPEPGMVYTQALVEGLRLTLLHDGTTYYYHQGDDQDPFLCDEPDEDSYLSKEDVLNPPKGDTEVIPPPGYDE